MLHGFTSLVQRIYEHALDLRMLPFKTLTAHFPRSRPGPGADDFRKKSICTLKALNCTWIKVDSR